MSSLAGCCLLLQNGLEPVMQLTCRDRNRIALQSNVLGAAGLGVRNILCLTGDHQSFGNHPQAKGVYDVDSIQLLQIIRNMKDSGIFESGDSILSGHPDVFLGAAANPFAGPFDFRVDRLEKKIIAGASFIQSQSVYDINRFAQWMDEVCARGLDKKVHILAGVTPLKSLKMTERMKFYVPGAEVPDYIYNRMIKTSDAKKEGFDITLELIQNLKTIRGVHGIHITALFWEEIIPLLVQKSGLLIKN
jgi:methylenetetrahydrofolate reductase (NADPH)